MNDGGFNWREAKRADHPLFVEAKAKDAALLTQTPNLNAYIGRIGARQKSFRSYVVEDTDRPPAYGEFRHAKAKITNVNGELHCDKAEFEPTEDELDLIEPELAAVKWPQSVAAFETQVAELKAALGGDPARFNVFQTPNADNKQDLLNVLFVQERIYPDPNDPLKKHDLPWTYWDDGCWRMMHPDGLLPSDRLLPLYNLPGYANAPRIMIHEGAMTARRVIELCEGKAPHPWKEELKGYHHLGWPGGAHNPQGVNWSFIKRLPHDTVVAIACDNDQEGKKALSEISRMLQRPLKAIIFDDKFKVGFDLADPFPQVKDWWNGERYKGPQLDDYVRPATWATTVLHTDKAGRPVFVLRPEFAKEWVVATTPPLYANRLQPRQLLTAVEFNRKIRPFSHAARTAGLLDNEGPSQVDSITYAPKDEQVFMQGERVFMQNKQLLFNSYTPGFIRPVKSGAPKPFLEYMEHLVPKEYDRKELMRWCATLIARPDIRMGYGVLMISKEQGVGKSTLAERVLSPIIGRHNASFPSAKDVTENAFNHWIVFKRLVVIQEMYTGHSRATYDMMKTVMTDDIIHVNLKNLPPFDMDNWAQVYGGSNSMQALYIDPNDRRWLAPEVTEEKWPKHRWVEFNAWLLDDGLGIIHQWAFDFLKEHDPVMKGDDAPMTERKATVIAGSRNQVQQLAEEFKAMVDDCRERKPGVGLWVFTIDDLHLNWFAKKLRYELGDKRIKKATLREVLVEAGFFEPELNSTRKEVPRFKVKDSKTYIIGTAALGAPSSWSELSSCLTTVEQLTAM